MSSHAYAIHNEAGAEGERIERLVHGILKLEETNNKTKSSSDQEMVRKIVKLIEEEVDCY
jgi:(p)ppGpp synthase/HD superfamily hydrolase